MEQRAESKKKKKKKEKLNQRSRDHGSREIRHRQASEWYEVNEREREREESLMQRGRCWPLRHRSSRQIQLLFPTLPNIHHVVGPLLCKFPTQPFSSRPASYQTSKTSLSSLSSFLFSIHEIIKFIAFIPPPFNIRLALYQFPLLFQYSIHNTHSYSTNPNSHICPFACPLTNNNNNKKSFTLFRLNI
jgi:hypothetical protein